MAALLTEVNDLRLVLVEDETPGRQPFRELHLDLFGLLTGVAERDQLVGVSDHDRRPSPNGQGKVAADG